MRTRRAVRADSQFAADSPSEMTRLLLKHGANPLGPDSQSCTPLHLACQLGSSEVAKDLLDSTAKSASIDLGDHQGRTPLHCAAIYGHTNVVELLLGRGADKLIKDTKGNEAIELAVSSGHLHG